MLISHKDNMVTLQSPDYVELKNTKLLLFKLRGKMKLNIRIFFLCHLQGKG